MNFGINKKKLLPRHLKDFNPAAKQICELGPDWQSDIFQTKGRCFKVSCNQQAVAVCGFAEFDIYYLAWLILAEGSQKNLLPLTRLIKKELKKQTRPILTSTRKNFSEALRWVKILGFNLFKETDEHCLWLYQPTTNIIA